MKTDYFALLHNRGIQRSAAARWVMAVVLSIVATSAYSVNTRFLFMEAIESKGAPKSLESVGLQHLHIVNPRKDLTFEGNDWANMVTRQSIEQIARTVGPVQMVCIDIESWPTCNVCRRRGRSLQRYIQVLDWYRSVNHSSKLGFWGRPPKHEYFKAITPSDSDDYRDWQKHNDFYKPLAEKVDVIFPSLYARYDDVGGWVRHAVANIEEARKYGKPVYVFITPYYIESDKPYRKTPLDPAFWQTQLETAYQHADGLVIWTGPLKVWSDQDPWWTVTKAFLKSKQTLLSNQ